MLFTINSTYKLTKQKQYNCAAHTSELELVEDAQW